AENPREIAQVGVDIGRPVLLDDAADFPLPRARKLVEVDAAGGLESAEVRKIEPELAMLLEDDTPELGIGAKSELAIGGLAVGRVREEGDTVSAAPGVEVVENFVEARTEIASVA